MLLVLCLLKRYSTMDSVHRVVALARGNLLDNFSEFQKPSSI